MQDQKFYEGFFDEIGENIKKLKGTEGGIKNRIKYYVSNGQITK